MVLWMLHKSEKYTAVQQIRLHKFVTLFGIYDLLNDDFSAVYDVDTLLWLADALAVEVVVLGVT